MPQLLEEAHRQAGLRTRRACAGWGRCWLALSLLAAAAIRAEPTDPPAPTTAAAADSGAGTGTTSLSSDIGAYFTAPLHWEAKDWAWFGGSLAAIAAAHHYDSDVRTHFIKTEGPTVGEKSHDLEDIVPTVAVLGATWLYAGIIDNAAGHHESWDMLESAGLSAVSAYAFKFVAGREDPYQTSDPNEWLKGGSSFPSLHSTAAFAVGTVLAESGNDEYRWIRRLLGYGLGAGTSYLRLKHNQHWLSDTVAGAALGMASAHFVMNRHGSNGPPERFSLVPIPGGALLTYNLTLP